MQQALVQNFNWLVTNISLAGGELLDRLFEVGCLTEDEYFSVNSRPTESDKCRLLIFKMKNRGPHIIDVFLNTLADDTANVDIVRRVNESLDTLSTRKNSQKCFLCLMKATVEIRDVYDDLLTDGLITDELYGEILQSESPQSKKEDFWECVLNTIKESPDSQQSLKVLERSISKKYDHISSLLETLRNPLDVQCCYCRGPSRRSRHRPRDSYYTDASDMSTTSEHADVPDSNRSSAVSVKSRSRISAENTESEQTCVKMVSDTTNNPEEVTAYKLGSVDQSLETRVFAPGTDKNKQENNTHMNDSNQVFQETDDTSDSNRNPSIRTAHDTKRYATNLDHPYANRPNTNDRHELHESQRGAKVHWRPDTQDRHVLEQNVSVQSLLTTAIDTSVFRLTLEKSNMLGTKRSKPRQFAVSDRTGTPDVHSAVSYLDAKSTKPDKHSSIQKSNPSFAMTVRSAHVQQPDEQSPGSQRSVKNLVNMFEFK